MTPGGRIRVGFLDLSVRTVVMVVGIGWWIGWTLAAAGSETWAAATAAVSCLAGLFVLTAGTRTVGTRRIVFCFLLGGFLMSVSWLLVRVLYGAVGDVDVVSIRIVPWVEETLKLLPVVALGALRRIESRTWGAVDVMLMAAASGAGFGVVEEAWLRSEYPWPDVALVPAVVTESVGRVIAGHALWAALAGLGLGLALLVGERHRWAWLLAPAAFLWAVVDHRVTNHWSSHSTEPGFLWSVVNSVGLEGWLTPVLLLLGLLAATAVEARILYREIPIPPELRTPVRPTGTSRLAALDHAWRWRRARRAFGFAVYRLYTSRHPRRGRPAAAAALRVASHLAAAPPPAASRALEG